MPLHKTSRAFYEKFEAMKKAAHVTLVGSTLFGTREELQAKYALSPALTNIARYRFDVFYGFHQHKGVVNSLADNLCMYKHCILYEVLGLTPDFTDDDKEEDHDHPRS